MSKLSVFTILKHIIAKNITIKSSIKTNKITNTFLHECLKTSDFFKNFYIYLVVYHIHLHIYEYYMTLLEL